jgi:hypothetical protein
MWKVFIFGGPLLMLLVALVLAWPGRWGSRDNESVPRKNLQ